ncbi:hypothetical protein DACRYDRAFT_106200 [Dacryopinax primogenitus]|uniref:Trafficking protein particle complex subunit 10 n=1 Tax=Dacryopinax primogenitus (strain DJM 731) TaxID=1858805 RepID=M5GAN0_DACPD|nr:uncharacterized protein DACRYDRAFT_106200 [Dacryopinax primogenitus]EJU03022.1 hypothetical protein DACRYDRAFT_106200 [Dacryopinax primogenitus]
MVHSRVTITYTAPRVLASHESFPLLLTAFRQHLPLHNLHWKSAARATLRTVQELQIELVPLEEVKDEQASQVPVSLLERPLGNLFFVQCDDNDTYKATVRKQIRDWVSIVSQRRNQDYLVVLVVRPEARQQGNKLFQGMKSTMLDRLKSDFTTGKKDHCTQLNWSMSQNEPAGWADVITRLKEQIIASFDASVTLREEEVRRNEAQRHVPGWNFCNFVVLKESLALSYEGMNLLEDALVVYDELETSFYQVLREMNLSWFGKLGGQDPGDDSLPLLSLSKKPYRDLMLNNTITVFDFRCYLLARQCSLLGQMLKVTRLARKAQGFISGFALTLEEQSKDTFPEYFLESWQFSSALSVVDQCQTWARSVTLDTAATISLNGALAELIELARNQLDRIGLHTGHLPPIDPYLALSKDAHNDSSVRSGEEEERGKRTISNVELLAAIKKRESFDQVYVNTTKRAIECCVISKRKRSALRLHFSLAVLDVVRGRPAAAASAYRSLPPHYSHSLWASLEAPLLSRSIACIDQLPEGEQNPSEWVADALGLMKALVGVGKLGAGKVLEGFWANEVPVEAEEEAEEDIPQKKEKYFAKLVKKLREVGGKLHEELRITHHPALALVLESKNAPPAEGQDGCHVDVLIVNALPCEILVDAIEVVLSGVNESNKAIFRLDAAVLPSGRTTFRLFSPSPHSGLYILDSSSIMLSHLTFYQAASSSLDKVRTVKLPADHACTTVLASPPRIMHLDQSPRLMLTVVAGRNTVKRAAFTISDLSRNVSFRIASIETEGTKEAQGHLEVSAEEIQVTDLPSFQELEFIVPYYGADRGAGISLLIEGTYVTKDQPEVVRTLHVTRPVRVTLPMAVNVQDFFRGSNTFSKFNVASDGQQYLRLLGAKLEGTTDLYKIKMCRNSASGPTVVSPTRQASFVFKLEAKRTPAVNESREPLRVVINYRSLWDEMFCIVSRHVKHLVHDLGIQEHGEWLRERIMSRLERENEQIGRYCLTGQLHIRASAEEWSEEVASYERGSTLKSQLLEALRQIAELITAGASAVPEDSRIRILSIPVDVPVTQILNRVHIDIPKHVNVYAGQPVQATLRIYSTIIPEGSLSQKMGFDVLADFSTWLVSGQKRGEFDVDVGTVLSSWVAVLNTVEQDNITVSIPLTLVPMRHGALFFPQVSVYPISTEDTPTFNGRPPELPTSDTYQANAADTILVLNRVARTTYMLNLPTAHPEQTTDPAAA